MINICVYEDATYKNLYPITYGRPIYDVLIGLDTLFEKVMRRYAHANFTLLCRDYLKPLIKLRYPDAAINNVNTGTPGLFINGRVLFMGAACDYLLNIDDKHSHLFTQKGQVVACYLKSNQLEKMKVLLQTIPSDAEIIERFRDDCVATECENIRMITNPWDIITYNEELILTDFEYHNKPGIIKGQVHPFSAITNETNVFIDENSVIEDFVHISAEHGPVYIESGVHIESHTRLEGPLFIGKNTKILGGKISASSIGAHCKVSGEVSQSVISSYSNKAHPGFLGHSYVGEWSNLGAGTTTSNLKNTYGPVSISREGQPVDTMQQFLGSLIGDHVKTGIQTSLTTGCSIGFGSMVFGTEIHQKEIFPFSWGSSSSYTHVALEKFITTAEKMMLRRGNKLPKDFNEIITLLYTKLTKKKKTTSSH